MFLLRSPKPLSSFLTLSINKAGGGRSVLIFSEESSAFFLSFSLLSQYPCGHPPRPRRWKEDRVWKALDGSPVELINGRKREGGCVGKRKTDVGVVFKRQSAVHGEKVSGTLADFYVFIQSVLWAMTFNWHFSRTNNNTRFIDYRSQKMQLKLMCSESNVLLQDSMWIHVKLNRR